MDLVERIADAWRVLLGRSTNGEILASDEIAALKSELASLGLELQEAKSTVRSQREMLDELEARSPIGAADPLEEIFVRAAGLLSQLRLQASLMAKENDVSARSVMALASELAAVLEQAGLEPIGDVGDRTPFDPIAAEPLSAGTALSSGTPVVIRFIGYRYKGEVLRKALVDVYENPGKNERK